MVSSNLTDRSPRSIVVVGGGVAGIVAAHLLSRRHQVTLIEKNDYLGGHTNTICIQDGPDAGIAVDTGFIVANNRTYPLFHRFLRDLDVGVRESDMSFSFQCQCCGFQYSGGSTRGLFARKRNAFDPRFWTMVGDILRFHRQAKVDLETGQARTLTLGEYLGRLRTNRWFESRFLLPMSAAIWSTSPADMLQFPAEPFLKFFQNHGLLNIRGPLRWQTVVGGSHSYVKAFLARFPGEVRISTQVRSIRRHDNTVVLTLADGSFETFDSVVMASHADQSLRMLADPSPLERSLLGAWKYQKNHVILHTDATVLPTRKAAWASWNYTSPSHDLVDAPVSLTYHMNRLQGLRASRQYCVTLNPLRPIDDRRVIRDLRFDHPIYSFQAIASQAKLRALNGQRNTWYCGSYFGYGFHEDAVRSAFDVARSFRIEVDHSDDATMEECATCDCP